MDAPPDYMVIDLELPERVRYYTCKEALPGGIEDVRYKTDFLAMRRIPAAGVEWRMGTSVSVRPGSWGNYRDSETTRYVKLTKDFYLAVYETTVRHFYWINNKNFYKFNGGSDPFASFGGDWDYPIVDLQFVVLRNWFHNANCGYLAGLADPYADDTFHKFWPRDGHEIDAANTPKCNGANCVGGGSYTPTLRVARTRYGIDFDMPTETEWEFACRAGTGATLYNGQELGPNNALDPALDEIAWYYYNSVDPKYGCSVPHPVGLKKPNGYGLYDMLGNAGEMCLDVHTNYAQSATAMVDPKGAVPTANIRGLRIVVRGGAFHSESTSGTRSGARYNSNGSGCVKDQQSLYWGQPKSASGAEAALSNHASGIRLWAPCKAVK